jgi:hypothetical protein
MLALIALEVGPTLQSLCPLDFWQGQMDLEGLCSLGWELEGGGGSDELNPLTRCPSA